MSTFLLKKKIMLVTAIATVCALDLDSSFTVQWHDSTWGEGGLIPAGPSWNMVGPYDFDNDGFGDFIVSSAYAGQFCNGVYHYEAVSNDSIAIKWVYTFYNLSCEFDAYSSVAVGDLDNDGNLEILSLVDTSPGIVGQSGLQIFEWNSDSLSFPSQPTFSWDLGIDSVWEAGQIYVEDLDGDSKEEVIVSIMDGPWDQHVSGGSSRVMIFELDSVLEDSAVFDVEFQDTLWTNWSGYNISIGDLDGDELKEIYIVGFQYYHIIVFENDGEDEYQYQTDFYASSEFYERGNQSIIIEDLNNDGENELYVLTSGTNSLTGELLTPGKFYAAGNINDVSTLSFADLNFFGSFGGGLRQIAMGDIDGNGNPNLYLAGHYDEALYDWEYIGGDPLSIENFSERIIFLDDTTDDYIAGNDQGKVRVAKMILGDIDNDDRNDIIISSGSFAPDKPHLFMVEHNGSLDTDRRSIPPQDILISQNYPNPFNSGTEIIYNVDKVGKVMINIYDIKGQRVECLLEEIKEPGTYSIRWGGRDKNNKTLSSGIYFYKVNLEGKSVTKKMVLAK